ncbi:hypothetical protein RHSIM_Rhsim06G0168500 [Rhododendron simsii]|uniref:Uncharacterized protein n=1 Tax=Rhododendron simsii TaxID=118357 RepID=A0A834GV74_RHOSS|nr:hypothetical protein RHSIM_Rhsim06G0168100 [Rhododendron simsii]KAF7141756.1 hypothetical protein RHSIM_Rhsim06G0168300 [Rhododendron simsii]KAF7141812.1 hypothetical protein RHSIM_Rhsim06G0168500 [Rhododendron simsii]
MEIEINPEVEGSFQSRTVEAQASTQLQPIQLVFPTKTDQAWTSLVHGRRVSMIVDRCIIDYRPQCPINSTGRVRVYIYDTRLDGPDQEQAQFVFPVTCPVELHYFGTSYASLNDSICPWIAKYRLESSNIRRDVRYCKIKAYVKLCTAKNPEEIEFRPPTFKIKSKLFNEDDIDCSHVGRAPKQPQLCRTMSTIERSTRQRPMILPGLTFQQARSSVSVPIGPTYRPTDEHGPILNAFKPEDDPGPSISQVGSNNGNTIILEPNDLAQIVGSAVAQAIKASETQHDKSKKPSV